MSTVPWEEFDLSSLSYQQFLAFFFDRPVVGDEDEYGLFHSTIDSFVALNPAIVLEQVRAVCRSLGELTTVYSPEQLDQGLWWIFGSGIDCQQHLSDPTVDIKLRIDCVESMYFPFRDVVARSNGGVRSSYYMWWHKVVIHGLDPMPRRYKYDHVTFESDQQQMVEAMFRTLSRILALDHRGCQWCALHGLGHLRHPLVRDTVQTYLNIHRDELTDNELQWVEACRDGSNT